MARTDADEVKSILAPGNDYDLTKAHDLTEFIASANRFVTRVNTCASDKNITLSTEDLRILEMWVAAHLYKMSDLTFNSKRTGKASASYAGQTGMQLDATRYGQTAKMLDPSGCVGAIGAGNIAGVEWLGLPVSEQTDYPDRD